MNKKSDVSVPSAFSGAMEWAKNNKALNWISNNKMQAFGLSLGGLGVAGDVADVGGQFLGKVFKPRKMFKTPGIEVEHLENLGAPKYASKRGNHKMPTLKDVLIAKIAAAKRRPNEDAEFIEKIGSIAVAALRNKMNPRMQKTAALPSDPNSVLNALRYSTEMAGGGLSAIGQRIPKFIEGLGSTMMPALQLGSLGAVGAMGAGAIYDKVKNWAKVQDAYDQMFQEFPNLNEVPREQVDKYWGVLSDFAPILTTNPLVAGQFINNMLNYGVKGVDHVVAGQLLEIQNRGRQTSGIGDAMAALNNIAKPAFEGTMSPDQQALMFGGMQMPGHSMRNPNTAGGMPIWNEQQLSLGNQ
jgi:hypothetical protein